MLQTLKLLKNCSGRQKLFEVAEMAKSCSKVSAHNRDRPAIVSKFQKHKTLTNATFLWSRCLLGRSRSRMARKLQTSRQCFYCFNRVQARWVRNNKFHSKIFTVLTPLPLLLWLEQRIFLSLLVSHFITLIDLHLLCCSVSLDTWRALTKWKTTWFSV